MGLLTPLLFSKPDRSTYSHFFDRLFGKLPTQETVPRELDRVSRELAKVPRELAKVSRELEKVWRSWKTTWQDSKLLKTAWQDSKVLMLRRRSKKRKKFVHQARSAECLLSIGEEEVLRITGKQTVDRQ